MPLLNYTTSVSATKTAGEIQELLVAAGAGQVMTEFENKEPVGIAFLIETIHGKRQFMVPVHADNVLKVLEREFPRQRSHHRRPDKAAATRVAWRILKDWVEAQLAIIQTEMVTLDEVMLPYMKAGPKGETVYEMYLDQQLALGKGE